MRAHDSGQHRREMCTVRSHLIGQSAYPGAMPPAPSPPDVTVITVTYNASTLVQACLAGLAAQRLNGLTMEIVVVDNDSKDGTADLVAAQFPHVRVIRSPTNLGFAAGNNLALSAIDSPLVILLNNDAVPEPDFVASLVRHLLAASPTVRAVAARVLLSERVAAAAPDTPGSIAGPDGTWIPDPAGAVTLVNSTGNEVRADGYGLDRGWLANAESHHPSRQVFGFSGAAAILKTETFRELGGFDERLFMYYEDTDLSWRLRRAGGLVEYCEQAVVHHIHSASSGEGSDFFRFHDHRNRLLVLAKNASPRLASSAPLLYVLTAVSIALRGSRSVSERLSESRLRIRVLRSYLALLPHALRERRRVRKVASTSHRDIAKLFAPLGSGTDAPLRRA